MNHTREKISNKDSPIPELRQLHQLLIEPIAQYLPDDPEARVILIPQSELFLLPFPALQDAQGNYLIQNHTLLTAPAIQALDFSNNPRQTGAPQTTQPGALVVGNPTMPKHDPPLKPLPGAEKEANQIAQVLNTQALTKDAATKSAVLSQLSQSSVIHLATHGTFDERRGMDSAVALAPSPRNPGDGEAEAWEREDGFLTAGEIVDLKIPAELVVLSACDTGRGAITGDGVIGLSRAWLMAGTSTVFVSLWRIDDNEPLTVISEFYQQLQTHPDAAAALRQGMLKGIDSKVALKNWAAFTVIGEAQVPFVSEQSRGGFALSWIEIGILSVAGVGVMLILQRQLLPRVTPAWSLVSKQRHLLIPAVGVVAAVFVVNGSIQGVQWWLRQPIEYHNPTYGLKLQVPRQWTIQEPQDPIRGIVAMFIAPPESGKAQFYSNVSIAVQDLSSSPKTLEQYTDKAVQEIQEYLQEAMFLQPPTSTSLGNHPAYRVMYIGKVGEREVQRLQVWMMKEDLVYVITYESEKGQFNPVSITVEEMIKSLEIEEVSP